MIDIYKRKEAGAFPVLCDNLYVLFAHVYRKQRGELLSFTLIAFGWNCFRGRSGVWVLKYKKKKKVVIFQNLHTSSSTVRVREVC